MLETLQLAFEPKHHIILQTTYSSNLYVTTSD